MYLVLKVTTKGKPQGRVLSPHSVLPDLKQFIFPVTDPSMVSAYMYPAGAPAAQAAPQAPAGPTTSPAYSSYQPTPTPGYQVCGQGQPLSSAPSPCLFPHFPPSFHRLWLLRPRRASQPSPSLHRPAPWATWGASQCPWATSRTTCR